MQQTLCDCSRWFFVALVSAFLFCNGSSARDNAGMPVWNVRDFGAAGDGRTLDTSAINRAIGVAHNAGGGTVLLPAGIYASYSIHLQSHVTLYLESGATIVAAEPAADGSAGYDAPEPNPADLYQDFGHSHWHNSLIWGENIEDVAIVGPGRVYGRGLSSGDPRGRRDLLPEEKLAGLTQAPRLDHPTFAGEVKPGPFGLPSAEDTLPIGVGNKAIALKNARNVTLRDFSIYHGGHFAVLVTGVDTLTVDNLKIDTNRDGIDVDASDNVRITNATVNSPNDDAIVLKSSYALGYLRPTRNVIITGCYVSGFDEGTLLNGKRSTAQKDPTGRIKLGTESSGGFVGVAIANCVFEHSRGLAIETTDGGILEDVTVTNLVMRDVASAPIFVALAGRGRAPDHAQVSILRRVNITNIVASQVSNKQGILITGLQHHPIEGLTLGDIQISFAGGGTLDESRMAVPEREREYPEPGMFGTTPSYGLFARHVRGIDLHDVRFTTEHPEARPVIVLDDVQGFSVTHSTPMADRRVKSIAGRLDLFQ